MRIYVITFLLAALSTVQLFSQSIQGVILNEENNNPIQNANISIVNSTRGTVSNDLGIFKLKA